MMDEEYRVFDAEVELEDESVLRLASDAVEARAIGYGEPADNHACTAEMVTAYLRRRGVLRDGAVVSARDVCWINIFQKASRDANEPKLDNLVDAAGYADNAGSLGRPDECPGSERSVA